MTNELAGRLSRRLFGIGGSLGAIIAVYYGLWAPLRPSDSPRALGVVENLLTVLIASAGAAAFLRPRARRHLRERLAWVEEGRRPTAAEQAGLVALPRRIGLQQLTLVLVLAVILAVWNAATGGLGAAWARALIGVGLFGVTLGALAYLLTEQVLRPAYGLAGADAESERTLGVRARLLLAWAVGSGVPLLFIVAIPLRGAAGRQLSATVPMVFMAISGLVLGVTTTIVVARSVAYPLGRVRDALQQVRLGNLEVEIPVEDPGEIGLVQASFNAMVTGLRERRQLQDLFGRHVGEEVARRALKSGVSLGGELRQATILFVDVVASTALAETHAPVEVVSTLNRFFAAVVDCVEGEAGWVDKFEGDAALAVFGVPSHQADHADRGLRAARSLRAAVQELDIDVGIGVTTGEVVAGNVGTERRHEFTVIGRPVNQAARLADAAKDYAERVLVSMDVVAIAGDEACLWRPVGAVTLRGMTVPLPVATLVGPGVE